MFAIVIDHAAFFVIFAKNKYDIAAVMAVFSGCPSSSLAAYRPMNLSDLVQRN